VLGNLIGMQFDGSPCSSQAAIEEGMMLPVVRLVIKRLAPTITTVQLSFGRFARSTATRVESMVLVIQTRPGPPRAGPPLTR
jgi:hypothetical protein